MKKTLLATSILWILSGSVTALANESVPDTESAIQLAQEVEKKTLSENEISLSDKKNSSSAALPENEIPLNFEKEKKSANAENPLFKLLLSVSVIGVIATGAVIFIRKYSLPKQAKFQTPIKVLQQHYLGPKKSLAIVRVAGESILIGITDHNISHIKTLSLLDEELPEVAPTQFEGVLKGMDADKTIQEDELSDQEDFAISKVRDVVSKRLKNMRSLE